ncbi:MAG: hypothetical protein IJO74_02465 [Clostridia bacterium]|nr:hypothetical protein [Clostridia bacterium]
MKKTMIFSVLLVLALCAGAFFWHRYSEKDTENRGEITINSDDREIYDSLAALSGEKEYFLSQITAENAVKAIEQIKPAENFYAVFNVERVSGNKSLSTQNKVWKSGDMYRVEIRGHEEKVILCNGEKIKTTNKKTAKSRIYPVTEQFSYAEQIGVADIKYILECSGNEFISAQFARTAGNITGGNIIFVEFYYKQLDMREEFYISADYGIVLSAQTYMGDALSYRLTTEEFVENYFADETMFLIKE